MPNARAPLSSFRARRSGLALLLLALAVVGCASYDDGTGATGASSRGDYGLRSDCYPGAALECRGLWPG